MVLFSAFSVSTAYAAASLTNVKSLKETSATISSITLKWSKVTGANGYQIYKSKSKSGTYKIDSTVKNGSSVSYQDCNLTAGNFYYYKVRAYKKTANKTYYGAYSSVISAATNPETVSGIALKNTEDYSVILTWNAVTGASKYNIYYSTSENGTYKLAGNSTTTSYEYKTDKSDTFYFKVAAVKTAGSYHAIGTCSNMISCKDIASISEMLYVSKQVKDKYGYSTYTVVNPDEVKNTVISTIKDKIDKNDFLQDDDSDTCFFICPANTDVSEFQTLSDQYDALMGSGVTFHDYGQYYAAYLKAVAKLFNVDYDDFFFKKAVTVTFYAAKFDSYNVIGVQFFTNCTGEEYEQAEVKAKEIAATFSGSAYDKIKAAYDYLVQNADYDYDESESNGSNLRAHSAYGALIEKLCVCDGFSEAFYLLMEACDIPCNLVINENHCWNEVMLNNKWYFLDVTNTYFLYGQDIMAAKNNIDFITDGDNLIWDTDRVDYFGYSTFGNSSRVTLAEKSYNDMNIRAYYGLRSISSLKLAS